MRTTHSAKPTVVLATCVIPYEPYEIVGDVQGGVDVVGPRQRQECREREDAGVWMMLT